jgi:hypothetical protein
MNGDAFWLFVRPVRETVQKYFKASRDMGHLRITESGC